MIRYPVAVPDLSGNEERYAVEAIRSTWISSSGRFVDRFETEFARLCGTRSAISVCNGTAALHLALLGLGLGPGDEVIVPALTYVATGNAVRYVGAEPVFADSDPGTWCLDPADLERCLTERTRGIIAVHLYGHPADMDAINEFAAAHRLWVVEDAAQAHAATYRGRAVGSLARLATFSFYGNKLMTSGEGGAVTVDDADLESRLRQLRGQGVDPSRRYFFPITGYNFRLTNLACALLCGQLEHFDAMIAARRRVFAEYRERLAGVPGIGFQPVAPWAVAAPWLFCITVDEKTYGCSRDELAARLAADGVDTRPFFIPLHRLPPFHDGGSATKPLRWADELGSSGLNLPTYAALSSADLDYISERVRSHGS